MNNTDTPSVQSMKGKHTNNTDTPSVQSMKGKHKNNTDTPSVQSMKGKHKNNTDTPSVQSMKGKHKNNTDTPSVQSMKGKHKNNTDTPSVQSMKGKHKNNTDTPSVQSMKGKHMNDTDTSSVQSLKGKHMNNTDTPSVQSMKGHTGRYLLFVLGCSVLFCAGHLITQVVLLATPPYGHILGEACESGEKVARQLGFQRFDQTPFPNIVRLIFPDIAVASFLAMFFLYSRNLERDQSQQLPHSQSDLHSSNFYSKFRPPKLNFSLLMYVEKPLVIILTAAAGITHPSFISLMYFAIFLGLATWWSCYRVIGQWFEYLRAALVGYSGTHLLLLYLYQFQFMQSELDPTSFTSRFLGLTGIIHYNCDDPLHLELHSDVDWPVMLSPAFILALYWVCVTEIRQASKWKETVVEAGTPQTWLRRTLSKRTAGNTIRRPSAMKPEDERVALVVPEDYGESNEVAIEAGGLIAHEINDIPENKVGTIHEEIHRQRKEETFQLEQKEESGTHDKDLDSFRTPLMTMFVFIMKQSYIAALIVMMAWSITYHSWLTFVLLIWACVVWMCRSARRICLLSSPAFVFYAEVLLVIQFVYGLNLTEEELPTKSSSGYNLEEIGLVKYQHTCLHLTAKILYTLMFWLTLRQHIWEKKIVEEDGSGEEDALTAIFKQESEEHMGSRTSSENQEREDSELMKQMGNYAVQVFSKYWIFVCAGMFLLVSLSGKVVMYRILYMALFLFFIICYQLSYTTWRRIMRTFWWVVIGYSMFVLILLYTYQFKSVPQFWHNKTHISFELLEDLGMEQYSTVELFQKMLAPTTFLVVCILQLHFFHHRFLEITKIDPEDDEDLGQDSGMSGRKVAEEDLMAVLQRKKLDGKNTIGQQVIQDIFYQIGVWYEQMTILIWRMLELHFLKVLFLTMILVAIIEVSVMNLMFLVLWSLAIPLQVMRKPALYTSMVWAAFGILTKMLFQLSMVKMEHFETNCTVPMSNITFGPTEHPLIGRHQSVDSAEWVGYRKSTPALYNIRDYLVVVLFLVLFVTIERHQKHIRLAKGLPPEDPLPGIIFPSVKRVNADEGLFMCLKYFTNFFFYKFGLEMCYMMAVFNIWLRLDFIAVLHGIWLGIILLYPKDRKDNLRIWPYYAVSLSSIMIVEYLLCMGLPPGLCVVYPWYNRGMPDNLVRWMFLPDYNLRPNSWLLLADFFQLLFVSIQWQVFLVEGNPSTIEVGGDNQDIHDDIEAMMTNPVPDFTVAKSYLDMIKQFVFGYLFWVTLAIVFITGTTRISLFCLGYLVGCFYFLLHGQEFLMSPTNVILKRWHKLIAYNFAVIFIKGFLQVAACAYLKTLKEKSCFFVQLLSLVCMIPGYDVEVDYNPLLETCQLPMGEAGLAWDVFCFGFLLLQKRCLSSYYFLHVQADLQAQSALASRGAELIRQNLIEEVKAREEEEKKILVSIKKSMERIRAKQAKFLKKTEKEKDHFQTIRGGDYYLFESDSDESDEEELEEVETKDKTKEDQKAGPLQILHAAVIESQLKAKRREARKKKLSRFFKLRRMGMKRTASVEDLTEEELKEEREEQKETLLDKLKLYLRIFWLVLVATIDLIIDWLNSFSHHYRHIAVTLQKERRFLAKQARMQRGTTVAASLLQALNPAVCPGGAALVGLMPLAFKATTETWDQEEKQDMSGAGSISEENLSQSKGHQSPADLEDIFIEDETPAVDVTTELPATSSTDIPGVSKDQSDGTAVTGVSKDQSDGTAVTDASKEQPDGAKASPEGGMALEGESGCLSYIMSEGSPEALTKEEHEKTADEDIQSPDQDAEEKDSVLSDMSDGPFKGVDDIPPASASVEDMVDVYQGYETAIKVAGRKTEDGDDVISDTDGGGPVMDIPQILIIQPGGIPRRPTPPPSRPVPLPPPDPQEMDVSDGKSFQQEVCMVQIPLTPESEEDEYEREIREADHFSKKQPRLLKLCFAIWYAAISRSEMLCYFLIIMSTIKSASLLAMPLPMLVFLWAMLSVPRPSKRFWMTTIIYSEVMIVIKYLFQFDFFPWNNKVLEINDDPFWPPRILGIEKKDSFVVVDLALLLALFFHRSILKAHGLWKDTEFDDEMEMEEDRDNLEEKLELQNDQPEKKEPDIDKAELVILPSEEEDSGKPGSKGMDSSGETISTEGKKDGSDAFSAPPDYEETQREDFSVRPVDILSSELVPKTPTMDGRAAESTTVTTETTECGTGCEKGDKDADKSPPDLTETSSFVITRKASVESFTDDKGNNNEERDEESQREQNKRKIKLVTREQIIELTEKTKKFFNPVFLFYYRLLHPKYSAVTDVYVLIFLCDFINFIIVIFGYWAFGKHSAGADVMSSISENQVPLPFLVMLLIQFAMIVVDRALYLRKNVPGKFIFQIVLVIGVHLWMFFVLPGFTDRPFVENSPAQLWYFTKCVYFGLSAYQIRSGYPTRILGNFLTKKYNYINLLLFQGFQVVPFLVELRYVMDWVWTDTTLGLSSWLQMEDIYANIFCLKCMREAEKRYPIPRGVKKKAMVKYGAGGLLVFLLIIIIWFPLLFMSLVNTAGLPNHPIDATIEIAMGGYQPLFKMSAQQQYLRGVDQEEYDNMFRRFLIDPPSHLQNAMTFLSRYEAVDIVKVKIDGNSRSIWGISPPSRHAMLNDLLSDNPITVRVEWQFTRDPTTGSSEFAGDEYSFQILQGDPQRLKLAAMLNGTLQEPVEIYNLFPKYVKVPGVKGVARPANELMTAPGNRLDFSNVTVRLNHSRVTEELEGEVEWWTVQELVGVGPDRRSMPYMEMITFNDKVSPPEFSFLAGYGIVGLYLSLVLVVGKFVRMFVSGISYRIMFTEMPNVDRILKLCLDIFLVRETGELSLEEDLFSKLIFLYRSPETMIKWSKEKTS
ncbi:piezo-type mechanosensitive ion channel component 2-like isoform X10 [Branchiostoma floridae]|uniref:Piezo-type mechanosensitive ion channel component 2-like isoform X10 n=1 Tax=Branchiostoma floridae TaxID=7739 RepID=A0A9J7LAD6_BRAFL|nr:piezo-type mechanosensitive ion channel component 2-like isoform X10 [Branchiostoma floridae]